MLEQVALFEQPGDIEGTLATFWACVYGIARVTDATPQAVLEFAFRNAPPDATWQTLILPYLTCERPDSD